MEKTATDNTRPANLSGFYRFLKRQYQFSEDRIRGIIACTGVVLNRVQDLTMSRSDLERIRRFIRGIGLTGDTLNFYMTSFIFYMKYVESAKGNY